MDSHEVITLDGRSLTVDEAEHARSVHGRSGCGVLR